MLMVTEFEQQEQERARANDYENDDEATPEVTDTSEILRLRHQVDQLNRELEELRDAVDDKLYSSLNAF